MRPLFVLLLSVAAFFAGGCTPKNQLDWKVSAKNPDGYNEWSEKTLPKLEQNLQREYNVAFSQILSRMPNGGTVRHMQEAYSPICQRINNRTIRDVIIDGYGIEREKLLTRAATETDMMLRNAKNAGAIESAKTEARFAQVRGYQQESLDRTNARLAAIEARLKELSPPAK